MIYTVKAHDREKRKDIEQQDTPDQAAALRFYNYLYEKYGDNERYDVSIDMNFGPEGESDGENSDVRGGDTSGQLGDQDGRGPRRVR